MISSTTRVFVAFTAVLVLCGCQALAGVTTRVSVASDGTQGNYSSEYPSISTDGRYVAFHSHASNLVPGDTNGCRDIFVHDRQTRQTERVSIASDGVQGNSDSYHPSISADGRFVAFQSSAYNLIPGDTNGYCDVFVHDRQTRQTERVSVASDGAEGNAETGYYYGVSISGDGRYVAFESHASNLVPGDTNDSWDVFVRDRQTGQTNRVSVSSDGTQGDCYSYCPSVSTNGRYVAFFSYAATLVTGDTNGATDVFIRDLENGQTERISVSSNGQQGNSESVEPSVGADGRYVAFTSSASNLVHGDYMGSYDVFVRDSQTGRTEQASLGYAATGASGDPCINADGRFVAFHSAASNMVSGDTNGMWDIFVRDRQTRQVSRVSVSSAGTQGNGNSYKPSICAEGRLVAFQSSASNLVLADTNGHTDVFVHDGWASETPPETIPLVKAQPDGTAISLTDKLVTAGNNQLTSTIYIEEDDRSSGIKVYGAAGTISQGDKVDVEGTTSTGTAERMITNPTVTVYPGPFPEPKALSLLTKFVGGEALNDYTPGVAGGWGAHNTGLAVQVWGRVTYVNATSKYFYVDDGCKKLDGSGQRGVQVLCSGRPAGASPIALPALNSYVTVTGISSRKLLSGSTYIPIIRPRTQSDIVEYP